MFFKIISEKEEIFKKGFEAIKETYWPFSKNLNVLKEVFEKDDNEFDDYISAIKKNHKDINHEDISYKLFEDDNFTSTVTQIISHILFRERSIDTLRNLEFKDVEERLTDEKIDAIISLEGPSRTKRTIDLILQTVFYW